MRLSSGLLLFTIRLPPLQRNFLPTTPRGLKNNKITVSELLSLLSQFADDTDVYLKFEKETIDRTTETLDTLEDQLGLKIQ